MLLSAVSVLVVAQSSSEIPEGLMNNPVHRMPTGYVWFTSSPCPVRICRRRTLLPNGSAEYCALGWSWLL